MEYITDTDFIPRNIDQDPDLFKILYFSMLQYDSVYNRGRFKPALWINTMIYDLIASVPLGMRNAIARTWIDYIKEARERLLSISIEHKERLVYIPFLYLRCTPQEIIYNYRLAIALLENDIECNWLMDDVIKKWLKEADTVDAAHRDLDNVSKLYFPWREYKSLFQLLVGELYIETDPEKAKRKKLSRGLAESRLRDLKKSETLKWPDVSLDIILYKECQKRGLLIDRHLNLLGPNIANFHLWKMHPKQSKLVSAKEIELFEKIYKVKIEDDVDYYREFYFNDAEIAKLQEKIEKKKKHPGRPSTFEMDRDRTDGESYCLVYTILRICCDIVKRNDIDFETEYGNKLLKNLTISAIRAITSDRTTPRKDTSAYSYVFNGFDKLGYENYDFIHSELKFYLDEMSKSLVPKTTKNPEQKAFFEKALDIDVSAEAIDQMIEQLRKDYSKKEKDTFIYSPLK